MAEHILSRMLHFGVPASYRGDVIPHLPSMIDAAYNIRERVSNLPVTLLHRNRALESAQQLRWIITAMAGQTRSAVRTSAKGDPSLLKSYVEMIESHERVNQAVMSLLGVLAQLLERTLRLEIGRENVVFKLLKLSPGRPRNNGAVLAEMVELLDHAVALFESGSTIIVSAINEVLHPNSMCRSYH